MTDNIFRYFFLYKNIFVFELSEEGNINLIRKVLFQSIFNSILFLMCIKKFKIISISYIAIVLSSNRHSHCWRLSLPNNCFCVSKNSIGVLWATKKWVKQQSATWTWHDSLGYLCHRSFWATPVCVSYLFTSTTPTIATCCSSLLTLFCLY